MSDLNSVCFSGTFCCSPSGDWVESLTALEYKDEEWKIFNFHTDYIKSINIENEKKVDLDSNLKHDF